LLERAPAATNSRVTGHQERWNVVHPKDRNRGEGDFRRAPLGTLVPPSSPFRQLGVGESELGAIWMPAIEVHRDDDELVVRADLPGMEKDDVRVDLEGQTLTIQGERRLQCDESDREGHHDSECRYGAFFRSIPLPTKVDPDGVRAEFQDGVLEVHVPTPRREESRKRIEVRGRQGDSTGGGRSRP
jgi:HSP20 family protein